MKDREFYDDTDSDDAAWRDFVRQAYVDEPVPSDLPSVRELVDKHWPVPGRTGHVPFWRRRLSRILTATLALVLLLALAHHPFVANPGPIEPMPTEVTIDPGPEIVVRDDYEFDRSYEYTVKAPDAATIYGNETYYIRNQAFPALKFRHAWFVKCGPIQCKRLHILERRGDYFVANCSERTGREAGFVLIILVLSSTDSEVLSSKKTCDIEIDVQEWRELKKLYRSPVQNAEAISLYLAKFRTAWGLPDDALLVAKPYRQVAEDSPSRD